MTTTTGLSYNAAANQVTHADNGIDYAYREIATSTVPLVLLQHFRGNLDHWDPPLVDAVGAQRCAIAFDNVGVGATTGSTPTRPSLWASALCGCSCRDTATIPVR